MKKKINSCIKFLKSYETELSPPVCLLSANTKKKLHRAYVIISNGAENGELFPEFV